MGTDLNEVFKDIDGDLTFEFALSDENILGVAIVDEMLEFTSFQDVHGQTELVVTASNPMRASVSDTVMVTVLPVNDPPFVLVSSDTTYFDEDEVLSLPSIVEMMDNGAWFDVDNSLEDLSFSLSSGQRGNDGEPIQGRDRCRAAPGQKATCLPGPERVSANPGDSVCGRQYCLHVRRCCSCSCLSTCDRTPARFASGLRERQSPEKDAGPSLALHELGTT